MLSRSALVMAGMLLVISTAATQETRDQHQALALLAKIDGKVKFDPAHPKRVIAVDL